MSGTGFLTDEFYGGKVLGSFKFYFGFLCSDNFVLPSFGRGLVWQLLTQVVVQITIVSSYLTLQVDFLFDLKLEFFFVLIVDLSMVTIHFAQTTLDNFIRTQPCLVL